MSKTLVLSFFLLPSFLPRSHLARARLHFHLRPTPRTVCPPAYFILCTAITLSRFHGFRPSPLPSMADERGKGRILIFLSTPWSKYECSSRGQAKEVRISKSWKSKTRLFSSFLFFFKYIWGQRWGETRGNFCERSVYFFEIFKVYRGDSHPKTKSEIRERRGESNFESIIRWYPRGRKRRIHAHTRAHSSKQNLLRKRDVPLFCRATQKRTHVSKHFASSNFICAINIERQLTPKGFFFFVSEEKDDLRFHPPALEGSEKAGKIEGRKW